MADIVRTLLSIQIDSISALQIYMAYLEGATVKDIDARTTRFVRFVQWMVDVNEHFSYALLQKYANHLASLGNAKSTITVKVSNLRQFLLAAEQKGLITNCVYYAKRGKQNVALPIISQTPMSYKVPSKQARGFKKSFLYDLFQLPIDTFSVSLLKKSFRRLATNFHPDHNNGSQEKFLACKEAYEFLLDSIQRDAYNSYLKKQTSAPSSFVHSIYQRIGGYSAISF